MDWTSPNWYASYILVLLGLAGYGSHRLMIVFLYLKHARKRPEPTQRFSELPLVTVQLPVFNEMHVVDRLLGAVAALDYPKDKMQIQLLDDSTDETVEICAAGIARLREAGFDAEHIHRITGDIPQNVNFAVKGAVARAFLLAAGMEPPTAAPAGARQSAAEIASAARDRVVQVLVET